MIDKDSSKKTVILLADDDDTFRLLAKESLTQAGFLVEEASNGREALVRFHDATPDIVLLDIKMPELDGYTVCREIRQTHSKSNIPIIMITGYNDVDTLHKSYESGATDFITKPVNWNVLAHRVKFILRANQQVSQIINKTLHDQDIMRSFMDSINESESRIMIQEKIDDDILLLEEKLGTNILCEVIDMIKSAVVESDIDASDLTGFADTSTGNDLDQPPVVKEILNNLILSEKELSIPFTKSAIKSYLKETSAALEIIQNSIEKQELLHIVENALIVKSKSRFLGAMRMAHYCAELEILCGGDYFETAQKTLDKMNEEFERVKDFFIEQIVLPDD